MFFVLNKKDIFDKKCVSENAFTEILHTFSSNKTKLLYLTIQRLHTKRNMYNFNHLEYVQLKPVIIFCDFIIIILLLHVYSYQSFIQVTVVYNYFLQVRLASVIFTKYRQQQNTQIKDFSYDEEFIC